MSELLLERRAFDAREAKEKRLIQHIVDGNPAAARMIAQRSAQDAVLAPNTKKQLAQRLSTGPGFAPGQELRAAFTFPESND